MGSVVGGIEFHIKDTCVHTACKVISHTYIFIYPIPDTMTSSSYYNIEVAHALLDRGTDESVDRDAVLADYARVQGAVWFASDCNPRTGKRCNCYQFPFTSHGAQAAAGFIVGLPTMFNIDEVGIVRHDGKTRTFTFIFPYPRESMCGDAVYEALNASHPLRRFAGACLRILGM